MPTHYVSEHSPKSLKLQEFDDAMWHWKILNDTICNGVENRSSVKARSHDPILRILFLVPKIGRRRSDCPIWRFHFCGENVGRSFVVCSPDPIFRINKESSVLRQNDHRHVMQNLWAPFILQEECRVKTEHVLFLSVFSKLRIRVSEGHFHCVHTVRFSEPTKIGSLKTDRVNGP